MFSKKFAWLALFMLLLPLLAACGGDTTAPATPTNTTAAAPAPTDTTAAAPEATATTATTTEAPATTGAVTPPSGDVFSWRSYAEPETMDPALMQENLSIDIGQNFYDALTEFDPDTQKVRGALAESWDVSPDAAVYTFHLRKDAKFSNGDPVTSADVLYSYNRVANTKEAPYEFVMEDIKGFSDVRASITSTDTSKPKVTTVSGLEAPDPYTVKITLANPSAYFIAESTVWTYYIVNKKQVDKGGEWWIGPGAGTGAYTLTEWKHNESMSMEPNANFWGQPKATVKAQVLILKDTDTAQAMFESGQLGALDQPDPKSIDRIKGDSKLSPLLHSVANARTTWLGLNVMKPPFGPIGDAKADKLRQAFAMSIDRQQLTDLATAGTTQPVTTLLPPGVAGYQQFEAYKFDPDQAKKLLSDAGYPNCQGLDLTYTYRQRDLEKAAAEQLQAQWKENLGCSIKIEGIEWKDMLSARQAHQYTMFYGSWGQDYNDPQDWLFALFDSNQIQGVGTGSGNDPGYSNKQFDDLVRQANQMADPTKVDQRMNLYHQAEQILLKDAPIVPLYAATRYWEVQSKWKGYNTSNQFVYPFRYITLGQ